MSLLLHMATLDKGARPKDPKMLNRRTWEMLSKV